MSKERPILFSGNMVRAILAGTKVQTRRIVKGASGTFWDHAAWRPVVEGGEIAEWRTEGHVVRDGAPRPRCPYGVPGDRLWVRETWAPMCKSRQTRVAYRAGMIIQNQTPRRITKRTQTDLVPWPVDNTKGSGHEVKRWQSPRFMPRWASRIDLEIVSVRVERLQDITEDDAESEGMSEIATGVYTNGEEDTRDPRKAFRWLWNEINGKRAPWESDPWIWVVSFKRVRP